MKKNNLTMKLLIIATITFAYSTAFAQKYAITKGKEGGLNIKEANDKFDEDDKHFYFYKEEGKREKKQYSIFQINKTTLKKEWEQDVNISNFKYELPIVFMPVFTDKKIMLFANYFNKEKHEAQLFVKIISLDGKTEKDWFQLSAMHSDAIGFNGRKFYNVISPDKSKLLIVSEFKWPKKPQEVSAQFYDISTFEKIGNKITLPDGYKAGGISSENYKLDDAGNFSYLFYYLLNQSDNKDISVAIGIYPDNSQVPKIVELSLNPGQEFVSPDYGTRIRGVREQLGKLSPVADYTSTLTKDGRLMYSGFFKDIEIKHSKKSNRAGVFNYVIDIDGSLASRDIQYFPDDVEAKLNYSDGGEDAPTGKKIFKINSVTEMDGAYYLLANHQYYGKDGNGNTTHMEREFVFTKINGKGKIEWIKVYPKYSQDRLNLYNMMVHNHKIYFFYLEHPKNLENSKLLDYNAKKYAKIKNYHGSVMVGLELNADGSASRKSIAETDDWFYNPSGLNYLLEKENTLLLRMKYDNKERYDVLKVE